MGLTAKVGFRVLLIDLAEVEEGATVVEVVVLVVVDILVVVVVGVVIGVGLAVVTFPVTRMGTFLGFCDVSVVKVFLLGSRTCFSQSGKSGTFLLGLFLELRQA